MNVVPRLTPYTDRAYALLRIVAGFAFSLHGWLFAGGLMAGAFLGVKILRRLA